MPRDARPSQRPRRRYHFGSPALVYILVTLLLALGAFNSQNNLLFWAFGFSLAILVVSGTLSGAMLMGIEVRRDRVADAEVGSPLTIRYRVRNRNRLMPAFALSIDELPADFTPKNPHSPPPRAGRTSGTHSTITRVEQPRAFVAHLGPRDSIVVTASPRAIRRGPISFRAFVVSTSFPFGLVRKSLVFAESASAVIRPAPIAVEVPALAEQLGPSESDRSGRLRGPGDEFHSLREYNPGDNPRAIAWKPSARRGTLLVRQSLAPAPQRLWIVLRLRIDPEYPDMLDEQAIGIAAAIIHRARAGSAAGTAAHGGRDDLAIGLAVPVVGLLVPPNIHPGQADRLLRELGLIELGPPDTRGLREAFPHISSSRDVGGCICIHAGEIDTSFAPADTARRPAHIRSFVSRDELRRGSESPSAGGRPAPQAVRA